MRDDKTSYINKYIWVIQILIHKLNILLTIYNFDTFFLDNIAGFGKYS
jgi:hypothetical protein